MATAGVVPSQIAQRRRNPGALRWGPRLRTWAKGNSALSAGLVQRGNHVRANLECYIEFRNVVVRSFSEVGSGGV